jgi:hypothetical protein
MSAVRKLRPKPDPADARLVRISLDDDVVLATDLNGVELLEMSIRVMDRKTREYHWMELQYPLERDYDQFRTELAEVLLLMGQRENFYVPDDIKEFTEENAYKIWANVTSQLFFFSPARNKMIDLCFRYLNPWVDGIGDIEKVDLWLRGNLCVNAAQRMLTVALCINDVVKKNASWITDRISQRVTQHPSVATWPKKQDTTSTSSAIGQRLKPASGI